MKVNPQRSAAPAAASEDTSEYVVEFKPEEMQRLDSLAASMGVPVEQVPGLLLKMHLANSSSDSEAA